MRIIIFIAMAFYASIALATPALEKGRPIYMDADKLGYDQKNAIVIALGNVRVVQGPSTLHADRITYFQDQNIVRADGNVRVEDSAQGETYYADKVQLKDDLMQGVIRQFRVRMADNSQFAAHEARRIDENKFELKKAVYSPCKICKGEDPFWQLKANKVEIDDVEQQVTYDDVSLEMMGLPVFYSPYLSHPTPDADAKSGLLQPTYSQSSNLGTTLQIPYYLALAPDKDATITPYLTSEDGAVMIGQYRQRTNNGYFQFDGSITYPDKRDDSGAKLNDRELRGHLFARGSSAINEHWNWGFDIQRTTDDTYLRRYDFNDEHSLTSRIFTEGLYGRSYALLEGLTFQGLEEGDDPDRQPYILPLAQAHYESGANLWGVSGLRQFHDLNIQAIARKEGAQSRRVSVESGLKLPIATAGGHLLDVSVSNRTDLYSVDNLPQSNAADYAGEKVRIIPTVSADWRYPLARSFGRNNSLTLEPRLMMIARPNGLNPNEIANEDNKIVEFSSTNLFSLNPFPGLDTVDAGSRAAYGLSGEWWMGGPRYLRFLLGQSISAEADTPFPYNNESGEHFSDYVGRVAFDYDPFGLSYRFRLQQEDASPVSQTVSASFNYSPLRLNVDYLTIEQDAFLNDREEVYAGMGLDITDEWSIHGHARRDILLDEMRTIGSGFRYNNDCFTLDATFIREFIRDRDIEPDDRFSLRIGFKNLAEFEG